MKKIFQPKVIIGSVCGFIASIIGFIAIFFPSLFNLETKNIDEITIFVHSENDSKALYDFLKSHENKIVKLNLTYVNYGNLYDVNTGYDEALGESENSSRFYDNTIYYYIDDYKGSVKLSEKEFDDPKNSVIIYEYLRNDKKPKKYFYTPTGENKLFSVISEINYDLHWEYLYRENGGIGFWNPSMKIDTEYDEGFGDLKFEFAYQIVIQHKSDNQKLYKWGKISEHWKNEMLERLSGVFFVNPEVGIEEITMDSDIVSYMSPKYKEKFQGRYGEAIAAPRLFMLDPLSKKELEMKKY